MASQRLKSLTPQELAEYNGQNGKPAYVAFKGRIYDASQSRLWKSGRHSGAHSAGEDLTERMGNAPHDESLLERLPVVGELVQTPIRGKYIVRLQNLHLHPIIVHFSETMPILAAFFAFLFIVIGDPLFEDTSFLMILLSGFSAFGCMASGLFSWTVGYEGRLTTAFLRKIVLSIILTIIIAILLFWRTYDPDVLTGFGDLSSLYLLTVFAMVPIATLLGHYGGKIVHG